MGASYRAAISPERIWWTSGPSWGDAAPSDVFWWPMHAAWMSGQTSVQGLQIEDASSGVHTRGARTTLWPLSPLGRATAPIRTRGLPARDPFSSSLLGANTALLIPFRMQRRTIPLLCVYRMITSRPWKLARMTSEIVLFGRTYVAPRSAML
jgi:hypothetical protein